METFRHSVVQIEHGVPHIRPEAQGVHERPIDNEVEAATPGTAVGRGPIEVERHHPSRSDGGVSPAAAPYRASGLVQLDLSRTSPAVAFPKKQGDLMLFYLAKTISNHRVIHRKSIELLRAL